MGCGRNDVKPGEKNFLAVYIEPPFHPGIAHEQSLAASAGDNGGVMMLDGPTFGATEGWDWIPGVRDRNIGIWQDVVLTASSEVKVAVPQIITHLTDPNPAETRPRLQSVCCSRTTPGPPFAARSRLLSTTCVSRRRSRFQRSRSFKR